MKIFLIWPTGVWKTTCAILYKKKFGYEHIQASKILTYRYPKLHNEEVLAYKNRLTKKSLDILKNDPDFFSLGIKYELNTIKNNTVVIEWIRNPRDFMMLYTPNEDIVWRFEWAYKTNFEEKWLTAIDTYLSFLQLIYPNLQICNRQKKQNYSPEDNFTLNTIAYE